MMVYGAEHMSTNIMLGHPQIKKNNKYDKVAQQDLLICILF